MAVVVETEDFFGSEIVVVALTPSKKRISLLSIAIVSVHIVFISLYMIARTLQEPFDLIANLFILTFWGIHIWVTVLFACRLYNSKRILSIRANLLESRKFSIPISHIKEIIILGDSVFFSEYARVKILVPLKMEKVSYTYGFVSKKDLHDFINSHLIPRNHRIITRESKNTE